MRIWVVGCSWGCGAWNKDSTGLLHGGVAQYLREDGHEVFNFSSGGLSNLDLVHRIRSLYGRKHIERPDMILVFQTEYSRDYKHDLMQHDWGSEDWVELYRVQDLVDRWLGRFYQRLSELAVQHSVPIKIIGGCGDGMIFNDMSQDYPGCEMVCQSATNLMITGCSDISEPIFSWYSGKKSSPLVERLYRVLPKSELPELVRVLHEGFLRESLCREHPRTFWPDGVHPNQQGHFLLFEHLRSQNLFG